MSAVIIMDGERYLTLEGVAECYGFSMQWVSAVYEHGLLGTGRSHASGILLAAAQLDRLAEIRRLHRHLGIELEWIELLLERPGE